MEPYARPRREQQHRLAVDLLQERHGIVNGHRRLEPGAQPAELADRRDHRDVAVRCYQELDVGVAAPALRIDRAGPAVAKRLAAESEDTGEERRAEGCDDGYPQRVDADVDQRTGGEAKDEQGRSADRE